MDVNYCKRFSKCNTVSVFLKLKSLTIVYGSRSFKTNIKFKVALLIFKEIVKKVNTTVFIKNVKSIKYKWEINFYLYEQ